MIIKVINQEENAVYDLTHHDFFIGGRDSNVICGGDFSGNVIKLGEYKDKEKAMKVFYKLIEDIREKINYGVGCVIVKMPIELEEGENR